MDAISFVLGEKTQHLRVRNLRVRLQSVGGSNAQQEDAINQLVSS